MQTSSILRQPYIRVVLLACFLLLIPFVAMQFSNEVKWTFGDFAVAGALLLGTGFFYEFAASRTTNVKVRLAIALVLLAILLLVRIELAVGISGK